MKPSAGLTAQRADELLKMKKIFSENSGHPLYLEIDHPGKGRMDIPLISEDGLEEFVLTIIRSQKRVAKVSFNHKENIYNCCLFRLDFNSVPHTNPQEPNEHVPEKLKKYAGNNVGGFHVHYYVEGYGHELSWALPLKETEFAPFEKNRDIEASLQEMLDLVCKAINLSEKIVYNQRFF